MATVKFGAHLILMDFLADKMPSNDIWIQGVCGGGYTTITFKRELVRGEQGGWREDFYHGDLSKLITSAEDRLCEIMGNLCL